MQPAEQLVSAPLAGEPISATRSRTAPVDLERLLKREAGRLLAYFARRVDPSEDAADLLSQTMIVAWRRHGVIPHDETEARMWLFGVARKVLSTHKRGVLRRSALAGRLRDELAATRCTAQSDGSGNTDDADYRVDALRDAIADLKPEDRDIIALVHWDGFSLAESAKLLNQHPGTTRSRYHRARKRLKELLDQRLGM